MITPPPGFDADAAKAAASSAAAGVTTPDPAAVQAAAASAQAAAASAAAQAQAAAQGVQSEVAYRTAGLSTPDPAELQAAAAAQAAGAKAGMQVKVQYGADQKKPPPGLIAHADHGTMDAIVNALIGRVNNITAENDRGCDEERMDSAIGPLLGNVFTLGFLIVALGSCGLPHFLKRMIFRRFSVFSLIMMGILVCAFIIKVSGQGTFVASYKDYLQDPGYECPCDRVCAHPYWEPDVSSESCETTDNPFEGGYLCIRKAGRLGCFTEDDCVGEDILASCTQEQKDNLSAYWYSITWLDYLEFYHILSSGILFICIVIAVLEVSLAGSEHMRVAYRSLMPWLFNVFMLAVIWEVVLEDLVSTTIGYMFTGFKRPCPETDTAKDAHIGKVMNVFGSIIASVALTMLSLNPAFMVDHRPHFENICSHTKIYAILVASIGVIGFAGSYTFLGGWAADIDQRLTWVEESYWAYSGTWVLMYSLPMLAMACTYVFELLSRSGVISKAEALGNSCYMIQALNVVSLVSAIIVEIVVICFWVTAYFLDTICFSVMTQGREITGFNEETCTMAHNVYNETFYGMCLLGPLGGLAGGFCIARTWGVWTSAYSEEETALEKMEEFGAEHHMLMGHPPSRQSYGY